MSFKSIAASIENDFRSADERLVAKWRKAKEAAEELALHVENGGVVVAEDVDAIMTISVAAMKREIAVLEAKIAANKAYDEKASASPEPVPQDISAGIAPPAA